MGVKFDKGIDRNIYSQHRLVRTQETIQASMTKKQADISRVSRAEKAGTHQGRQKRGTMVPLVVLKKVQFKLLNM